MKKLFLRLILSLTFFVLNSSTGYCEEQDTINAHPISSPQVIIDRLESIEESTFTISANYKKSIDNIDILVAQQKNLILLMGLTMLMLLIGMTSLGIFVKIQYKKNSTLHSDLKTSLHSSNDALSEQIQLLLLERIDEQKNKDPALSFAGDQHNNPLSNSSTNKPNIVMIENPDNFVKSKSEFIKEIDRTIQESIEWIQTRSYISYGSPEHSIITHIIHKFLINSSITQQIRWRGIVTCLEKGVIVDEYLISRIQGIKSDSQKMDRLEKPFYQEFLKVFISNTMILLEELRNLKEFVEAERSTLSLDQYSEISNLFSGELERAMQRSEKLLGIQINYVKICAPLKDFSKFAEATDKLLISPYFSAIATRAGKNVKGVADSTFIVEVESYSSNSEHEAQQPPKTIVKVL